MKNQKLTTEQWEHLHKDFDEIYKRYDKQKEEIKRLEVENRELSEGYNEEFKENARLNNIINELEKYIRTEVDYIEFVVDPILDKLQELKGADKE